MQKLTIIGNVCAKPELRYTPAGKAVYNFTVAVNKPRRAGQERQEAYFFNCAAWERLGEECANLDKGSKVYVEGIVSARAYKTQTGDVRATLEVTAREVEFLTRRTPSIDGQEVNKHAVCFEQAATKTESRSEYGTFEQVQDDDLPF